MYLIRRLNWALEAYEKIPITRIVSYAPFQRRTFHVANLTLISKYNCFCSSTLGSAHETFDV